VVSIDWDYFVEENPMLDWGHRETTFFLEHMWHIRRVNTSYNEATKSFKQMLVDLRELLPFRGSPFVITRLPFTQGKYQIGTAESHAAILQLLTGQSNLEIVNIDAHHDIHYGKIAKDDKSVECGSWGSHLIANGRVKSWLQVYPDWRKKFPEGHEDKLDWARKQLNGQFDVVYGAPPIRWRNVDYVFICRSGCWAPPEYDKEFSLLCMMLGAHGMKEREITVPKLIPVGESAPLGKEEVCST
jgi:hypothetical protein